MRQTIRDLFLMMLVFGVVANAASKSGNTELHIAVMNQDPDQLENLLASGTLANSENANRRSALHYAVLRGPDGGDYSLQMTRQLLSYGANPNLVDSANITPVDVAIARGSHAVVRLLLENGANPNRIHRSGYSILTLAMMYGRDDVARTLQQFGAMHGVSPQEQALVKELPNALDYAKSLREELEANAYAPEALPIIVQQQVSRVWPDMSAKDVDELVEKAEQLAVERQMKCRLCSAQRPTAERGAK